MERARKQFVEGERPVCCEVPLFSNKEYFGARHSQQLVYRVGRSELCFSEGTVTTVDMPYAAIYSVGTLYWPGCGDGVIWKSDNDRGATWGHKGAIINQLLWTDMFYLCLRNEV